MSNFPIPEKALRLLDEVERPKHHPLNWPRGWGFVCCECRCPVDEYVRGAHEPGCTLAIHNESLAPGYELFTPEQLGQA